MPVMRLVYVACSNPQCEWEKFCKPGEVPKECPACGSKVRVKD
jgi:hypothetical protein